MIEITRRAGEKPTPHDESYASSLRAIGQSLEAARVHFFDIEARGGDYFIWDRTSHEPEDAPSADAGKTRQPFAGWLGFGARLKEKEAVTAAERQVLRFTARDIDRLEREGRARRRETGAVPDAYRMSQLLRALGGYVNHVDGRLLGVSWRSDWIGVVYEKSGQRELEVFRPASIYDFWVRMYLRRNPTTH